MWSFEVLNALIDLDQRTPVFFQQEIFAHGDLKVRKLALEILRELEPTRKTSRVLHEILKLH